MYVYISFSDSFTAFLTENRHFLHVAVQIMKKKETQSPTYTIHKNKFKVGKRLKYKS